MPGRIAHREVSLLAVNIVKSGALGMESAWETGKSYPVGACKGYRSPRSSPSRSTEDLAVAGLLE